MRAFYVGRAAAAARRDRGGAASDARTRRRGGPSPWGRWPSCSASSRCSASSTALPGFAQAHNTRLAIVACLALALLAGWGLDELTGGGRGRPGSWRPTWPPSWRCRWSSSPFALPGRSASSARRWRSHGASPTFRLLRPRRRRADGGRPGLARGRRPRRGAHTGRARAAAWRPRRWRSWRWRSPPSTCSSWASGQNPAIPVTHAEQPVTGAIRYLQRQRPARFAGLAPEAGIPPLPADVAHALRAATTRAATTIPSSAATTASGARRWRRPWRSCPRRPWHGPTTARCGRSACWASPI